MPAAGSPRRRRTAPGAAASAAPVASRAEEAARCGDADEELHCGRRVGRAAAAAAGRLWHRAARWRRAANALACSVKATLSAVGAAGGGWALVAGLRAATAAAGCGGKRQVEFSTASSSSANEDEEGPVPRHIAVIMDGNRRFGRREHGDTLSGHRAGGERLRDFVEWSSEAGVGYLTVFAFSTENWRRGPVEVEAMMKLFLTEVPRLGEQTKRLNVQVRFLSSDAAPLSAELRKAIADLEASTSACTGLRLSVCLSYGSRGEVAQACRQLAEEVASGSLRPEDIDEAAVSRRLLTGDLPDPDVLVRTSGECRLSNFLMYQLAYSELFFLDKHWPEVTRDDFWKVIREYRVRGRRFGK